MSQFKLIENGFLMLKEDASYASPIASLFYEYYDDISLLKQKGVGLCVRGVQRSAETSLRTRLRR